MRPLNTKGRGDYNRQERAFSNGIAAVRYFYDEKDSGREWMHMVLDQWMDFMDKVRRFPPVQNDLFEESQP